MASAARNRRRSEASRAAYDGVEVEDGRLVQLREQRRTFAAKLGSVPKDRVSTALAERAIAFIVACRAEIEAIPRYEDTRWGYYEYITRYLGIDRPAQNMRAIAAELQLAETTVRNNISAFFRAMRILLPAKDPELAALFDQARAMDNADPGFWERSVRNEQTGCLLWSGATDLGYGVLKRNGKKILAHRYAWELTNGEPTPGMHIVHTCGVRRCIEPDHLIEVLPGEINERQR